MEETLTFHNLNFILICILFFGGLLAGFIDSIAGGGGLISVPLLLAIGLDPVIALGTNKLQSTFGSFSSSYKYIKSGQVDLKSSYWGIFFTFIGAFLGAHCLKNINSENLEKIIPILLFFILILMISKSNIGKKDRKIKFSIIYVYIFLGLLIGFYDGFLGPGTGNFWVIALISIAGMNMQRATAQTKVFNFISNVTALTVFIFANTINYKIGLIMAAGQYLGAQIGAGLVIKKGIGLIKPIFITIVLLLLVNLTYKQYF